MKRFLRFALVLFAVAWSGSSTMAQNSAQDDVKGAAGERTVFDKTVYEGYRADNPDAVLYDNGPLSTGTVTKSGVASPPGSTWSEVQNPLNDTTQSNTSAGFSGGITTTTRFRLADNFTIPPGQSWRIDSIATFAYQTGSTPTSYPFISLNALIWNGRPGDVGSTVVAGDTTVSALISSQWGTYYRVFNTRYPPPGTAPGTTRPVYRNTANMGGVVLPAGSYWFDWQSQITASGAHFAPSVTVVGRRGNAAWNGRQRTGAGWIDAIDTGNPAAAPDSVQDHPFIIYGSPISSGPVYTSTPNKPINDTLYTRDTINIPTSFTISRVQVRIDSLTHTWDSDLDVFLFAPDGDSLELFTDVGGSGDNFLRTLLSDTASVAVTAGVAPFTGSYRPEGAGGFARFTGDNAQGNWVIRIYDDAVDDVGTLHQWSMIVEAAGTHDIGVASLGSEPNAPDAPVDLLNASRRENELAQLDGVSLKARIEAEERMGRGIGLVVEQGPTVVDAANGTVTLNALVRNFGSFTENSYQVGWSIDGSNQSNISNSAPLEVADTDTLVLTWNTPTPGNHTARAWTVLGTDANAANDTSSAYIFNVADPGVFFQQTFNDTTFPPAGWTTINRDGGPTAPWFRGTATAPIPPYEGDGFAGDNFQRNNGFYIDDYLITPNVAGTPPGPGQYDSLTFWARGVAGVWNDSLMVMVSTTTPDTGGFTTNLRYFMVPQTGWTHFGFRLPPALGPMGNNRYVAFRYLHYDGGPSGNHSNYFGIDDVRITRIAGTPPTPAVEQWKDHVTAGMRTTVTNEGNFGSLNAFYGTGPGSGYQFNPITTAGNRLFEGSLIISTDSGHVSDAARTNAVGEPFDADFKFESVIDSVAAGLMLSRSTSFNDSLAEVPLRFRVAQKTVSIDSAGLNTILIGQFDVSNLLAAPLNGLTFGAYFDWDLTAAGNVDRGSVVKDSTNVIPGVNGGNPFQFDLMEMHLGAGGIYVGIVPLSTNRYKARRVIIQPTEAYSRMTNGNKWLYTNTNRPTNPDGDGGSNQDHGMAWGHPTFNVPPSGGGSVRVGFAMCASTTLGGLVNAARDAQKQWVQRLGNTLTIVTGIEDPAPLAEIPEQYELGQNYPNPFNPTTTIRYALPEASSVTLRIYNVLGQEVLSLVDEAMSAGYHQAVWNGRNSNGAPVSTGIYFYRLEARSSSSSNVFVSEKKMLMLK